MVFADFHQLQILQTIIISDAIDMMNNFIGNEIAPKMCFHNERMFCNVSMFSRSWMALWGNRINITMIVHFPSIAGMILASRHGTQRTATFGTIMPITPFGINPLCIKWLSASFTMAIGELQPIFRIIFLALSRAIKNAFGADKTFWRSIKLFSTDRAKPIFDKIDTWHNDLRLITKTMTLYHVCFGVP